MLCVICVSCDKPQERTIRQFDAAMELMEKGNYSGAAELLERVVEREPQNDVAWYQLGVARAAMGRHDKAVEAFERTVELSPNHAAAWRDLGASCLSLGQNNRAWDVVNRLALIHPEEATELAHFLHLNTPIAAPPPPGASPPPADPPIERP